MSDTGVRSREFEIGRVISGTFGVIGRNFLPFIAMAVLLGGLPRLLVTLFQLRFMNDVNGVNRVNVQWDYSPQMFSGWVLGALFMLIAGFVLQASIVHATVADLNGRRVVVGESLKVGLRNCLPLIGLAILLGLGVGIGLILLIVPGVILVVMWSVAVPAKVVEKIGVIESFSRSSALTRGRRWPIFGLLLIYVIAAWIVEMAIMAAFMPFALSKGLPTTSTAIEGFAQSLNLMQLVASPIIATLTTLVTTTGGAVLYSELRGSREGGGHEALASVFD